MKSIIWVSFDLGVRGDYEGIYEFLDNHEAKECGSSIAVINYEFNKDLIIELIRDLKKVVKLDRRSRIYVVFPDNRGKYKGRFIVGKRKQAPWTGYRVSDTDEEDSGD